MFQLHSVALNEFDPEILKKIHKIDKQVNDIDKEISECAIVVLATRQPVAIDLRHVISALRMSVVIERMGDISKHIVDRRERIEVSIPKEFLDDVQRMNALVSDMLQKLMHAYKALDVKEALDVMSLDLEIDKIYSDLMNRIARSTNVLSTNVNSLMQFTISIKNIERLGDYIKKLARIVYYIVTGDKLGK
jgi:phosphate transport system protein